MQVMAQTGKRRYLTPARHRGFTLLEMAVVLVILGLLLGGLLMPLSAQMENDRRKQTEQTLTDVREAVLGFVVAQKRLPCPDTTGDGVENVPCTNIEGYVPWVTLGVGRQDGWSHPMRYRVDNAFSTVVPDPPNTTGGLVVRDLSGTALTAADPNGPVAILFSCGKDGLPNGGNDANGVADNPICENPGPPVLTYIQDVPAANFDDELVWISKNTLLSRLVAAGKWP